MHNIFKFYGKFQPQWNPIIGTIHTPWHNTTINKNVICIENAINASACINLIQQFECQPLHPVGIDGYNNDISNAGSYRTNSWAVDLSKQLRSLFESQYDFTVNRFVGNGRTLRSKFFNIDTPFVCNNEYRLLGSTPWMRFMRYSTGGMHVPHYDAPYDNKKEKYITIFSWVLFLNTIDSVDGGAFQFIEDDMSHIHPQERPIGAFNDWHNMAPSNKVSQSIQPRQGKLLMFPHWLCHQVQQYTGTGYRYIIRGDIAYGY